MTLEKEACNCTKRSLGMVLSDWGKNSIEHTMSIAATNVTTSATEIVAANARRSLLIIQNVSDTDLFLKLDSSETEVTTANGLKMQVGDSPLIITCSWGEYGNAIRAIHGGSGNKVVRITEE